MGDSLFCERTFCAERISFLSSYFDTALAYYFNFARYSRNIISDVELLRFLHSKPFASTYLQQ